MAKSRSNRYFDEFSELVENIVKKKNISVSFGMLIEKSIEDPKMATKSIQMIMDKHVDPAIIDSIKSNGKHNRIDVIINNWKTEEEIVELKKKAYENKIASMNEDRKDINKEKKKKNENLDKTLKYKNELITTLLRFYGNKDDKSKSSIYGNNIKALLKNHPGLNEYFDDFMNTRSNIMSILKDIDTSSFDMNKYKDRFIHYFIKVYMRDANTFNEDMANLVACILHNCFESYDILANILRSNKSTKNIIETFEELFLEVSTDPSPRHNKFSVSRLLALIYAITEEEVYLIEAAMDEQFKAKMYLETRLKFPNNAEIRKILEDDYNYLLLVPETGLYPENHPYYQAAIERSQELTENLGSSCIHPYNPYNTKKVGYIICSHGGVILPEYKA